MVNYLSEDKNYEDFIENLLCTNNPFAGNVM